MRVIIVGAGKIGYHIAQVLVQEHHDVVVLDISEERAKALQEELDVQVIQGSGASTSFLEQAGIKEAKLLVAVTESDEVNMISCILAKEYGVEKTVARVRNPEYVAENKLEKGIFSKIDLIINPELVTAKEIAKLINFPDVLDVEYYAQDRLQLVEMRITEESPVAHKKISELDLSFAFTLVGIIRHEKIIIPRGQDEILPQDVIYILSKTKDTKLYQIHGNEQRKAHKVMILGADLTGFFLASMLEQRKITVKIVEKNRTRCTEVAQKLENTLVLYGDGTDIELLKDEGAGETDVFVCLTDDDKINLLVGLLTKHLGTKRAIAQVRRSDYIRLMESVGIDVGVSPRLLTAQAILRFIKKDTNVLSATLLGDARAEMLEVLVSSGSKVVNKKIKDLSFPKEAIIGSICRNKQVIIPGGEDVLLSGDIITVFCLAKAISRIEDYFSHD